MPFLVLFLIIFGSTPCFSQTPNESPDQVWEVGGRRWTVEEEHRFGKWMDETMTEDFFIRHKIPTDCADAVYAIRWIYARINHLPAAATAKDGRLIGHWSTDWKHLPTHPEWTGTNVSVLPFSISFRGPGLEPSPLTPILSASLPIQSHRERFFW